MRLSEKDIRAALELQELRTFKGMTFEHWFDVADRELDELLDSPELPAEARPMVLALALVTALRLVWRGVQNGHAAVPYLARQWGRAFIKSCVAAVEKKTA